MTEETIVTIPWDQLHDSPLQYRQTYSEATINEIRASIVDTGRIHQPLVVRLRYPNPLFRDQYDPQDGFEIVFGHTRKRAGMLAGLAGAPCVVRALNDAEVRAAQAAENIARADVHPIEEAQGFRAMIDEDGVTADELAAQLGKSRSYVYGRLKLLDLCPEVRRAVLANEIGTEVGLLVARVGNAKMQGKALGYIRAKYYDLQDGGKKSFRQIRDLLNERFTLALKDAIFDVNDEMLVPSAGYCGRCPKRSGNAPEFADIAEPGSLLNRSGYGRLHTGEDVCTDPDCFDAKKRAHLAREAAKLLAEGKVVVTGNKARAALSATGEVKGGDVELSKVRSALKAVKKAAIAEPAVVMIQDQRTGKVVQAVKREDLQAAGAQLPAEPTRPGQPSAAEMQRRKAEREKEEAKLDRENARRYELLQQVRTAMAGRDRDAFDLRMVARVAFQGVEWSDRPLLSELWGETNHADLVPVIERLDVPNLTQFIMDCALVCNVRCNSTYYLKDDPEALMAAAEHYGLTSAKPVPTPSKAARAPKKPAAGAGAERGLAADADDEDPETAGAAGDEQMDDAGCAGGQLDAFAGVAA